MEDFEEKDIIIVDLESKESLKEALEQFKVKIIDNDLDLYSSDDYLKCFVKSVDGEPVLFEENDIEDVDFVNTVLRITYNQELDNFDDDCYASLSNIIVLAAALKYDDLKPIVVDVCKETITLVNKVGDNVWTDAYHVFGIELLVTLILKCPEYSYFISEYVYKGWDSEHAPYVYECLGMIRDITGFNKHLIKAAAFCKNVGVFRSLAIKVISGASGIDPYCCEYVLLNHFRENADDYQLFKAEYINYIKTSQINQKKSDSSSFSRVKDIIIHMTPEMSEEEWKTNIFIKDTIENEVVNFVAAVDEAIILL
ncbi:MAG: hypothetical protein WBG43_05625 [Marinifilaceae bacterium]